MGRCRLCLPTLTTFLLCLLASGGFRLAMAQTDPATTRALAMANAEAVKQKALLRLAQEGTHIAAPDRQHFMDTLRDTIIAELTRLRQSYAVAHAALEQSIGYGTSLSAMWQSVWNSPEDAQRVFQDKIDAAVATANLPAARERLNNALEAALLEQATALYTHSRQTFNQMLYEAIGEGGLLGPLTPALVKELLEHVDLTSHQLAVKEGLDPTLVSPAAISIT